MAVFGRPARLLVALVAPVLVVLGTAPPSYAGTLLASGDCEAPTAEIYRAKTSIRTLDLEPGGAPGTAVASASPSPPPASR